MLNAWTKQLLFCRPYETAFRGFTTLSNLTHLERAYLAADLNGPIDYEALIDEDNPSREAILDDAREFAAYGVL
jgi:hypothetical protein